MVGLKRSILHFDSEGVVYLFGKVYVEDAKSYVSCCVTVKDIERRIFVLPRVKVGDIEIGPVTLALCDSYRLKARTNIQIQLRHCSIQFL